MQDRICGRCDCVLRAGRDSKNDRWYKEPPSRFIGGVTEVHFAERGHGNPHAATVILAANDNYADVDWEENQTLLNVFSEAQQHHLHQQELGGITGLHPTILAKSRGSKFWRTVLGLTVSGKLSKGRGWMWEQWLAGELFVTWAVKCYTAGNVPSERMETFAKNCQLHVKNQLRTRQEAGTLKRLIVAGDLAEASFLGGFKARAELPLHQGKEFPFLPGVEVIRAFDPLESGGTTKWKELDGVLAGEKSGS